jgi:hypothetical protein
MLLLDYFNAAHVSGFCTSRQQMSNSYYYYHTEFWLKLKGYKEINISLNDKVKSRNYDSSITFCDMIVNLVINNFSFENEHYEPTSFKYLFIAAVGKELYEALKVSLK